MALIKNPCIYFMKKRVLFINQKMHFNELNKYSESEERKASNPFAKFF